MVAISAECSFLPFNEYITNVSPQHQKSSLTGVLLRYAALVQDLYVGPFRQIDRSFREIVHRDIERDRS